MFHKCMVNVITKCPCSSHTRLTILGVKLCTLGQAKRLFMCTLDTWAQTRLQIPEIKPSNGKCISVFYIPKTTKTTDAQFQICIFIDVNQTFEMTAIPQEKILVTPIIHQVDHMMGDSVWICLGVSCMYTYMSLITKINMLLCYAMLCYAMLCSALFCSVLLCYVIMLCYVMLL